MTGQSETVVSFITRMLAHGVSNLSADDSYTLLRLAEIGAAKMIEDTGDDVLVPPFVGPDDAIGRGETCS